jgi:hypothetical protein
VTLGPLVTLATLGALRLLGCNGWLGATLPPLCLCEPMLISSPLLSLPVCPCLTASCVVIWLWHPLVSKPVILRAELELGHDGRSEVLERGPAALLRRLASGVQIQQQIAVGTLVIAHQHSKGGGAQTAAEGIVGGGHSSCSVGGGESGLGVDGQWRGQIACLLRL